jgi:2-methylcitrate dehydratase PrpD
MTVAGELGRFAASARLEMLSSAAREALKLRLLDSLGCAIAAQQGQPVRLVRRYVDECRGEPTASLIGGGRTAPDRAALYNGALVRYLDFNDSYLAKGETCHPSDNVAPVLAAAQYAAASGRDFLAALAVAYQVQCRLSDVAPVRAKGFDHTTQGAYAVAAGVSRALGLDAERAANAVAIAGTALNALRVTRTGALSHWKGLAYPFTASAATEAAFLARNGITGPAEVFEGAKGFMDAIAGRFEIDWTADDLEAVTRTIVKRSTASGRPDVQGLLRRVEVRPDEQLSARFPAEQACRLRVRLRDGRTVEREKRDYAGFHTRPVSWDTAVAKFDALTGPWLDAQLRQRLLDALDGLEDSIVSALAELLERIPTTTQEAAR